MEYFTSAANWWKGKIRELNPDISFDLIEKFGNILESTIKSQVAVMGTMTISDTPDSIYVLGNVAKECGIPTDGFTGHTIMYIDPNKVSVADTASPELTTIFTTK